MYLGVEEAVLDAVLGEVGDEAVEQFDETEKFHKNEHLFAQLLLPLAVLLSGKPFVRVVDAVLLAVCQVLAEADGFLYFLERDRQNLAR